MVFSMALKSTTYPSTVINSKLEYHCACFFISTCLSNMPYGMQQIQASKMKQTHAEYEFWRKTGPQVFGFPLFFLSVGYSEPQQKASPTSRRGFGRMAKTKVFPFQGRLCGEKHLVKKAGPEKLQFFQRHHGLSSACQACPLNI